MERKNFFKNTLFAATAFLFPAFSKAKPKESKGEESLFVYDKLIEEKGLLKLLLYKRLVDWSNHIDKPLKGFKGFHYTLESQIGTKMMCKTSWCIGEEEEKRTDFEENFKLLMTEYRNILLQETLRMSYTIQAGISLLETELGNPIPINAARKLSNKYVEKYKI